jgi:hypothetical protein
MEKVYEQNTIERTNKVDSMMKKKFVVLLILLLFVLSLPNIKTTWVSAGEDPVVYIDPAIINTTALGPGTNFTISTKTDYNGSDIWGWDFILTYNPLVLNVINVTNGDLVTEAVDSSATFKWWFLNETTLRTYACFKSYPEPVPLTSGPGTLANVTFTVVRKAASNLTLGPFPETRLIRWTGGGSGDPEDILVEVEHGYFDNRFQHDVAVGSVTAPVKAVVGDLVPINMTVANIGKFDEVVNATIRYDTIYIDSENVTLAKGENKTALLSWNTTDVTQGYYTINATATVDGEGDPTDNWKTTDFLLVMHDVAVVNVTAPVKADVGSIVSISVEVENIGASPEDVEVVVSYDGTYIDSENVTLAKGANTTRSFSWNTTDVTQGYYTINATATVEGEGDPTDNWKTIDFLLVGHDVAVVSVTAPAKVTVGDLVPINVTVANIGAFKEDVNVTIRYDTIYIDSQNVTLLVEESEPVLFSWNTTGVAKGTYTINVTATVEEDVNPTDNWNTTTILLAVHDVAVAIVSVYIEEIATTKVYIGEIATIKVLVINKGGFNETFEVVVSYDGTYIDSENITLAPGPAETLFFTWNTAGVDPASYWINATATVEGDVDPADNWKTTTIDVKPSPGTIVGTVTDASTGLPIQGANVTANGDYNVTDADGHYMITGDPGDYNITASAAGYYSNSTSETIITEQTITVDFELTPLPGVIAGTVTDASTGDPISGANVTANGVSVSTGADGSYSIELAPGNYTVTASKDGYENSSKTNITVITGNTTTVDFELTPTQGIPWYLYVAAAGVVAIITVAIAFYFLRIRKPKPT